MVHDVWESLIWRKGTKPSPEQPLMSVRLRRDLRLAADFGFYAAQNDSLQALLDETCRVAAEGLEATYAKLLVYQPGEQIFVLQAGVGWPDGIVGQTRFEADVGTAAGFAWQSGQSIICNNLAADGRFRVPDLLIKHNIVRCINVVVAGENENPFGVLEVESPDAGKFAAHDAHFLQLLAQSLAAAIGQAARQAFYATQLAQYTARYEILVLKMQHRNRSEPHGCHDSIADQSCHKSSDIGEFQYPGISSYLTAASVLRRAQTSRDFMNPESCRASARAWTERAHKLPPGSERDTYLEIADGYASLADMHAQSHARVAARDS